MSEIVVLSLFNTALSGGSNRLQPKQALPPCFNIGSTNHCPVMSSESHGNPLLDTWAETSSHMFNSVVAANRAAFAAFGVRPDDETEREALPADRIEAGDND